MTDPRALDARLAVIEQRLKDIESRLSTSAPEVTKASKDLSIKEFILTRRPTGDVEKTLAIGYFLERLTGATSFNVDDLTQQFFRAKEAKPQNINHKVNQNIQKGHMTEAPAKKDKKKAWMLTSTGEQFVENGFKDVKN
jgi:hypothetical protein